MGISVDSPETHAELARRLEISFPLLSDTDLAVTHAYGVVDDNNDYAVPAVIVVAPDGTVAYRHVGGTASDRPSVDEVLELTAALGAAR